MCEGNLSGGFDVFSGSASDRNRRGRYFGPPFKVHQASTPLLAVQGADPAYAPHTPPYFYGTSKVRFKFTPTEDGFGSRKYTLDEIISQITSSYTNTALQGLTDGGLFTSSFSQFPAGQAMMQISSSVNLFGKAFDPIVTYDEKGNVQAITTAETPSVSDIL